MRLQLGEREYLIEEVLDRSGRQHLRAGEQKNEIGRSAHQPDSKISSRLPRDNRLSSQCPMQAA